ncbi:hypothetical protein [Paraburkholderia oxyphila]|uniref:hypothetical protein n=1 Tax=Paraburkholderia oxyphila TaxID=614212 RepID=UPI0004889775|nr:hypothetical protein [Paraburkholderia oxyphila]
MYHIPEVLFSHEPGGDTCVALERLRDAFEGDFRIGEHEFIDERRQVLRLLAATDEFESTIDFNGRLRKRTAGDDFQWKVIGAVPVGQTEAVLLSCDRASSSRGQAPLNRKRSWRMRRTSETQRARHRDDALAGPWGIATVAEGSLLRRVPFL